MLAIHALSAFLLLVGANARTISYEILKADFSKYDGLYQSVYSEKDDKLYVTNSVGRPPVKNSDLIEVNPQDLSVCRAVQPVFDDNSKLNQRFAVYGVDLDEENGHIWVTETRHGSVAYYDAADMTLGNQYPLNIVGHPRDVYVDKSSNLAWVSASTSDVVDVFSADKKDGAYKSLNLTEKVGRPFNGVMSLVADEEARVLYTVSLNSNLAAAIDLNTYEAKAFDLGDNVKSASGVAWDSKRKNLFVANQKTNNTVVLNPASGKVIADIKLAGGPLNARYDPYFDVVYVTCRLGHVVSVIDPEDFSIITDLEVETPNHVEIGPNGEVFVTDRSDGSFLYKFTPNENIASKSRKAAETSSA